MVTTPGVINLVCYGNYPALIDDSEIQLQAQLVTVYSHELKNPYISIQINSSANSSIYVTGEVRQPGVQVLRGKLTVAMALAASQVSQKTAGTKSVFLIRSMGQDKFTAYKLDATFPAARET